MIYKLTDIYDIVGKGVGVLNFERASESVFFRKRMGEIANDIEKASKPIGTQKQGRISS